MSRILQQPYSISKKGISPAFQNLHFFSVLKTLFFGLILTGAATTCLADSGQLDQTFGNAGLLPLTGKQPGSIAVQADGKFLIGVREFNSVGLPVSFRFTRYNTDGSIDNTFGNGLVSTDFNGGSNNITALVVQPDGKIVAAGYRFSELVASLVMARYNSDGTLDNTFNGNGKVSIADFSVGPQDPFLAIQSDGKIVASSYKAMIRFNANGSVDNAFGTSGRINFETGMSVTAIAAQSNKMVVTGYKDGNFIVNRYNADGTPDNSFDGDGQAVTDFGGTDQPVSIAIQGDGKIVVSGTSSTPIGYQLVIARYNVNGSLDNEFNGNGKKIADGGPSTYHTTLIQADGKILIAGGASEFSAARFNSNGSADNTFGTNGSVSLPANNHRTFGAVISGHDVFIVGTYYYAFTAALAAFSLDNTAVPGLTYRYYAGDFNTLPEFNSLIPTVTGLTPNVDISVRPAATTDHFAFVWEGYINIQTPGNYTFETVSDDGSKFYFNNFYSPSATALITNDGLHAAQSVTGSVNIPTAGLYPVAITYFEKDGGESMQLYWTAPGMTRQLIPNALFTPKVKEIDRTLPSVPESFHMVYSGRTFIKLDWSNSTDNLGVAGYRLYNNGSLMKTVTESNTILENLPPNFQAYVTIRAVDSSGNESFDRDNGTNIFTATSGLNYRYYSNVSFGMVGFDPALRPAKTGATSNIDISVKPAGSDNGYAFVWEGYISIPTPGVYTFETISDDGSKFYFNTPYSNTATPFVDNFENNGLHAPISVSKTINIPSAGLYPIALAYYQYGGGQTMQFYWQGPGIPRQVVPNSAFTDDTRPGSFVQGLNYKYYEGSWSTLPDFSTLTPVQTGVSATPDISKRPAGRNDNFAFVWEGYITLPSGGDYTFETVSDDGSKLYFNSKYVPSAIATVNNDGLHPAVSASAYVSVQNGGTYPIAITFFEATGDQKMEVYWKRLNRPRELIPAEAFSPNPSNMINRLNYKTYPSYGADWNMLPQFYDLTPTKTGSSSNVDINTAKIAGLDDGYGITWEGYIYLPAPGDYTFETISDDGSKLMLNNPYYYYLTGLVNNDGVHGAKSVTGTVHIDYAGVYPISLGYFEKYGGQSMEVYWSGPGIPRQKIPDEAFALISAPTFTSYYFSNLLVNRTEVTSSAIASQETSLRNIYPNPFNDGVTIEFENSSSTNDITIGLYDLNGRRVFVNHAGRLPAGNNAIKMNLNGLKINDGVYIVQIQKNGIVWKTAKVVKMKK